MLETMEGQHSILRAPLEINWDNSLTRESLSEFTRRQKEMPLVSHREYYHACPVALPGTHDLKRLASNFARISLAAHAVVTVATSIKSVEKLGNC